MNILFLIAALSCTMQTSASLANIQQGFNSLTKALPVKLAASGSFGSNISTAAYNELNTVNSINLTEKTTPSSTEYLRSNTQKDLLAAIPGLKIQLKPITFGGFELTSSVGAKIDDFLLGKGSIKFKGAQAQLKTNGLIIKAGQLGHPFSSSIAPSLVNGAKASPFASCKALQHQLSADVTVNQGAHVIGSVMTDNFNSMPELNIKLQTAGSSADSFIGIGVHAKNVDVATPDYTYALYGKTKTAIGTFKQQVILGDNETTIRVPQNGTTDFNEQKKSVKMLDYWLDFEPTIDSTTIKPGLHIGINHLIDNPAQSLSTTTQHELNDSASINLDNVNYTHTLVRFAPRINVEIHKQLNLGIETNWYLLGQNNISATTKIPTALPAGFGGVSTNISYSF